MPVYNGESYIDQSIDIISSVLKYYNISFEIIIVDDGSSDSTRLKASEVASKNNNVKIVGYNRNKGKGYAFIYGYKHCHGNIIVLMDADLDIPAQQIPIMLAIMRKTKADIVITNKWHPLSKTYASPLRRFLSKSYNSLVRLLTGLNLSDTQTGAKAFKRYVLDKVIPELHVKRFAFDVELLHLAKKHGFKIAEAPSLKPIRLKSSFKIGEIFNMILETLHIVYRHCLLYTSPSPRDRG